MDSPRPGESYRSWKERNSDLVINTGEFLVDSVIEEGSAARYSLLQDRLTAVEEAYRKHVEQMHNLHHVDVVHGGVKGWSECGMSSCRIARDVLDDKWWKVEQ